MTKTQEGRYWREWSKVRRVLVELGEYSPSEADAERHEIHRQALGRDKSHKDFNNDDLNRVFDSFNRILVLLNGPSDGPSCTERNLIWRIERTGLPEPYLESICRDTFGTSDWRKLPESDLRKFSYTAITRARTKAKAS